jgi:hypothetical protein
MNRKAEGDWFKEVARQYYPDSFLCHRRCCFLSALSLYPIQALGALDETPATVYQTEQRLAFPGFVIE